MAWYNILNTNCIFSLDFNSNLDSESLATKVYYSNNSNKYFSVLYPLTGKIIKENITGVALTNFKSSSNSEVKTYKTLKLTDALMSFNSIELFPDNFTLILKCKVNAPSVFLCGAASSEFGPCFNHEPLSSTESSWYTWRLGGFITGYEYDSKTRFDGRSSILTLVYRGSSVNRTMTIMTDYGKYDLTTSNSTVFDGLISYNKELKNIGYYTNSSDWNIDSNIIAYGLFDKQIPDEKLTEVFENIDSELLVNKPKTYLKVSKNSAITKGITYKPTILSLSLKKVYKVLRASVINNQHNNFVYDTDLITVDSKVPEKVNIKDYILEEGLPTIATLYLLERHSGQILQKTSSISDGSFEFKGLDPSLEYIIVSPDSKYQYSSILKDYDKKGYNK